MYRLLRRISKLWRVRVVRSAERHDRKAGRSGEARRRSARAGEGEEMTTFKTVSAQGLDVFYREAGDPANPKLLLLRGLPPASPQFRTLLPALAARFPLGSFDYPGFGNSERPGPSAWDYTFDHLAEV